MIADADLAILLRYPVILNTKLDIWITTSLSLNYECVHVRLLLWEQNLPNRLIILDHTVPPQYPSGNLVTDGNIHVAVVLMVSSLDMIQPSAFVPALISLTATPTLSLTSCTMKSG